MKNQQHHAHDTGGAEQIGRTTEAAKPCTLRRYGAELLPVAVLGAVVYDMGFDSLSLSERAAGL